MKYKINRESNYSLASIQKNKLPVASAIMSVDVHSVISLEVEAIQTVYPEFLLSGTKTKTREQIITALNMLGAQLDISINDGTFKLTIKSRAEKFSSLLKLTSEVLKQPAFSSKELERIKTSTINSLQEEKENSRQIALSILKNSFYDSKDRRYSCDIDKLINKIKDIKPSQIKTYHKQVLNQFVFISIAADHKEISSVQKVVESLWCSDEISSLVHFHKQKKVKPKVYVKNIPSRTNIDFSIGAPLPITLHHPDFIPLSFGLAVLGKVGGFSGRLMSTVREKEGLTYGIYAYLESFSGTEQGYWRIMTFFTPSQTIQGLKATFREVNKIYQNGITTQELKRFKSIATTQQALLQDSIQGQLSDFHLFHQQGFTIQEIYDHKAKINKLSLKEVNSAIKKHLDPKKLTVSGAGPVKVVKNDLVKFFNSMQ